MIFAQISHFVILGRRCLKPSMFGDRFVFLRPLSMSHSTHQPCRPSVYLVLEVNASAGSGPLNSAHFLFAHSLAVLVRGCFDALALYSAERNHLLRHFLQDDFKPHGPRFDGEKESRGRFTLHLEQRFMLVVVCGRELWPTDSQHLFKSSL